MLFINMPLYLHTVPYLDWFRLNISIVKQDSILNQVKYMIVLVGNALHEFTNHDHPLPVTTGF